MDTAFFESTRRHQFHKNARDSPKNATRINEEQSFIYDELRRQSWLELWIRTRNAEPMSEIDHLCIVYFISTTTEHVSAYLLASYVHTAGPVRPSPATAYP